MRDVLLPPFFFFLLMEVEEEDDEEEATVRMMEEEEHQHRLREVLGRKMPDSCGNRARTGSCPPLHRLLVREPERLRLWLFALDLDVNAPRWSCRRASCARSISPRRTTRPTGSRGPERRAGVS